MINAHLVLTRRDKDLTLTHKYVGNVNVAWKLTPTPTLETRVHPKHKNRL